ncbi:MAG: oxidoreductase [bacterium]|nr:oxidoreductase [bacterium]
MVRFIDSFLNSITMYRLVLNSLLIIALMAIIYGFLGMYAVSGVQMILSLLVILLACQVSNYFFAKLFTAQTNIESSVITTLILFLILPPARESTDYLVLALAGVLAMASKYVLAINKKHLFNPAAVAVVTLPFVTNVGATWWVGSSILLPVVLLTGLLIVRKIRRFQLFFAFMVTSLVTMAAYGLSQGVALTQLLPEVITSWPLLFFATIMLTEPLTTPPTNKLRVVYGGLVGVLFGAQFHWGPLYSSPELALVMGNIFSFIVSPKQQLVLTLKEKVKIGQDMFDFVFVPNQRLAFSAGQYLEWTLDYGKPDIRGNRRYFTVASAPEEEEVRLGVKIPPKASAFKRALATLEPGQSIVASQLAGDFTLPEDATQKVVFIAGGIGVTPFRSMIESLLARNEKRDIVMLYVCSSGEEFVYQELFKRAVAKLGIRVIYVITQAKNVPKNWPGRVGYLTAESIRSDVPDVSERKWYLSGPQAMVDAYKRVLGDLGVARSSIKTDYFPGF